MIRRALLAIALFAVSPAAAQQNPTVAVDHAWARATPGASTESVVYLRIVNRAAAADRLVAVTTPVAASAAVHETKMDHGMMMMRPVPALEVPAGGTIELAPGGDHIMLTGLNGKLQAGATFPLLLRFARAGEVRVNVIVERAGARRMEPQPGATNHGTMAPMEH
jgi:periplasmic copper chaperone A